MKQFFCLTAALLLGAGVCLASGFEATEKTAHYTVKVVFPDGQPVQGADRVRISVVDASSRPVRDAQVEIEYFMPSLHGKPRTMDYHASAHKVGEAYEALLKPGTPGAWKMALSIKRANRAEKTTVPFLIK
jgi:nitrogen fixation protein FixH